MPPTESTKAKVWVRSGGMCALCREVLLPPAADGPVRFRGDVAHIVAEAADGPRGASDLSVRERNTEANLLGLCVKHHREVDDDVSSYPVARLRAMKAEHEAWVLSRLTLEAPWSVKLHHIQYLNVPRLNLLAATAGAWLDVSEFEGADALHLLGWDLNRLLAGFTKLLAQVELGAVPIEAALSLDDPRGVVVSFNGEFRTKNVKRPTTLAEYSSAVTGDLKRDPHVYKRIGDRRAVVTIDPRWITTVTAFVAFRPSSGRNRFAGLGVINSCGEGQALVTPYLIGLPMTPFMEQFQEAMRS